MTTMIERVALAINSELATWYDVTAPLPAGEVNAAARAAIAAMREPTEKMLDAGTVRWSDMLEHWQAMIDAALEEKKNDRR